MKNKLLLIVMVGCFAGIVLGGTPNIDNSFKVERKVMETSNNFFTNNGLPFMNLAGLTSTSFVNSTSNLTDPCDPPPQPPGDGTPVQPSCVNLDDENQDPDPPIFGQTQKGSRPFAVGSTYVARYYKQTFDSNNEEVYIYYDERSLLVNREGEETGEEYNQGEDGRGFELQLPAPYQVNGDNYAYYRIDIVDLGLEEVLAKAYVGIYYMQLEVFPHPPGGGPNRVP